VRDDSHQALKRVVRISTGTFNGSIGGRDLDNRLTETRFIPASKIASGVSNLPRGHAQITSDLVNAPA
jgi:hypothetical protein